MKYKKEYLKNEPLSKYTTVGIGGPAEYLALPKNSDELIKYYLDAKESNIPVRIIGSGSAFLIPDEGLKGLVIINQQGGIKFEGEKIICDSGVKLQRLCIESFNKDLIGLENFAGIPCTVGGAIYNNVHGVDGHLFDEFVESVEYLGEKGEVQVRKCKDCEFGYDASWFQGKDTVITKVTLRLMSGDGKAARDKWNDIGKRKLESQEQRSMGCVFKNFTDEQKEKYGFPTTSVGWFIESRLGLHDYRVGDAAISHKHHNFIVNLGNASAKDYQKVIRDIQKKAKDEFGIELETEIEIS